MITSLIGTAATGLYSVGSKLGHASQLIYTAFAGGWQYFAFSTMNEDNQVESNSKVFEYLGVVSFIATIFCCLFAETIFEILFVGEYVESYIIAPYLFLAPLLQMLFQVEANQFIVVKKTWPNMLVLSIGAIANVMLNLYLIPKIGIEEAAISTLAGYTISDTICTIVLIKMQLMVVSKKFVLSVAMMSVFFIMWRFFALNSFVITLLMAAVFIGGYLYLYKEDLRKLKHKS